MATLSRGSASSVSPAKTRRASVSIVGPTTPTSTCLSCTGTSAAILHIPLHALIHPCRVPRPAPPGAPIQAHTAWLVEVLDDRRVNTIQEFLVNWEGNSRHQWCSGADLNCNDKLEEYAIRTGKSLDWRGLLGEPNPLTNHRAKNSKQPRILTYSKPGKTRPRLDWQESQRTNKKLDLKGSTVSKSARPSPTRQTQPRACKYT
jgi:hypothetical protein